MNCDSLQQNATVSAVPTVVQERALAALLGGATVTAAAKSAGVDRATVHRWLADDPIFIASYNSSRQEMVEAINQGVRFLAANALNTLRCLLTEESTPAAVRLKAAGEILALVKNDPLTGPTSIEDAEARVKQREQNRKFGLRSERLS